MVSILVFLFDSFFKERFGIFFKRENCVSHDSFYEGALSTWIIGGENAPRVSSFL